MKPLLALLAFLIFATAGAEAQNKGLVLYDGFNLKLWESNFLKSDTPNSFSREHRLRIGMKVSRRWRFENPTRLTKKLLGNDVDGESSLEDFIFLSYLSPRRASDEEFLKLFDEQKKGDQISANILGILMHIAGKARLKGRDGFDPPDIEAIALLFAAHELGFTRSADILDSFYFLFDAKVIAEARSKSRSFIQNPMNFLNLPEFLCVSPLNNLKYLCEDIGQ